MPPDHKTPVPLRSGNMVRHTKRFKVVKLKSGEEADVAFQEENKNDGILATAGVDADDANEHHLQAVLAAGRHNGQRAKVQGGTNKSAVYIPVLGSKEIPSGDANLYPDGKWTDPFHYLQSSDTVEQSIKDGLADGFTYFMDERDGQWLSNNGNIQFDVRDQEAERMDNGDEECKGEDRNLMHSMPISEDVFELVMGIFEKLAHETQKDLLDDHAEAASNRKDATGEMIYSFSRYEETFASNLDPALFASYRVPEWVPDPPMLSAIAKAVFPYWSERKAERRGLQVVPSLRVNGSETDPYGCFRGASAEKLGRLNAELAQALKIGNHVYERELLKKESAALARVLWLKRLEYLQAKSRHPSFQAENDRGLLADTELQTPEPSASHLRLKKKIPRKKNRKVKGKKPASSHDSGSTTAEHEAPLLLSTHGDIEDIDADLAVQAEKDRDSQRGPDRNNTSAETSSAPRLDRGSPGSEDIVSTLPSISQPRPLSDVSERPALGPANFNTPPHPLAPHLRPNRQAVVPENTNISQHTHVENMPAYLPDRMNTSINVPRYTPFVNIAQFKRGSHSRTSAVGAQCAPSDSQDPGSNSLGST
ncbi:hypothetical protein NEOLEDRAFT_1183983 [Neolentinus lepideus HHB14362 ss-1]|uniref:Enhancer of polycomb-like protein n=1 Tax=Neolentinus lepideus HHB14362 ss-1 TaxID=1314782 RepID=A0A165MTP4_9AGAM|nr:hypothetical protein NEOLEDRAFT_1183983 [Neolentinus lepideus HHB14362 ss-1]